MQESEANYWETTTVPGPVKPKQKKVTFDDILSHMMLTVNAQGVLQHMQPLDSDLDLDLDQCKEAKPLPSAVKNSPIYNKYFKNYNDPVKAPPKVLVPKTIEEYKQMVLQQKVERLLAKQRVEQIKPTKLFLGRPSEQCPIQALRQNRNQPPQGLKPQRNTVGK
jgi:hypothetical protein